MKTITLDELTTLASLQTRVDRKYIVDRSELAELLNDLEPDTRVLEIAGQRDFGYHSVYFDTPELASFLGAAHKRRRRFKIRTRTYLDSGDCYLEVKTEGARSATVKERLEHDPKRATAIGADGVEYASEVLAEAGIRANVTDLRPVLSTTYRRMTLFVPSSQSRATIDTDLVWGAGAQRIELPHLAIVETKSGSTPSAVDRMLWRHGHRPRSISKYATGMAAFHPDLPANKWAAILRNHFTENFTENFTEKDAS